MSHFDDIEPLVYGSSSTTVAGGVISTIVVLIAVIWAVSADNDSKELCEKHGEKYIDSRTEYTLCEKPDHTVIRR